uniref:Uncharacterized protein n=1 Tax=Arundo donax TaxID=35708 RepID=A0A0A9CG27_ARUDO
MNPVMVCSEQT